MRVYLERSGFWSLYHMNLFSYFDADLLPGLTVHCGARRSSAYRRSVFP